MAISTTVELVPTALWPQGDIRDPLGVWGARLVVTGDGGGGGIKVGIIVPAARVASYVYTCYAAQASQLGGIVASMQVKCRLLTNWPDIDPAAGVTGFSTIKNTLVDGATGFSAPITGPRDPFVYPQERFILLFDPRPGAGQITIVELETSINVMADITGFEAYGYFWDRSVLQAPGGPRHPGAN